MLSGKKTYIVAGVSAVVAAAAAYLGIIDWATAWQFIQTGAIGAAIRNGIPKVA